jgi:crossover junction endodeoxyribonuclease RusA
MVTLELPYPPSVNSIWRRGKTRSGKSVTYLCPKYKAWKLQAGKWFDLQKSEKTVGTPIVGPYEVHMTFSIKKRRKNTDLDNRIKAVGDALQAFGLIENDSKCEDLKATWGPVEGVFIRVFKA